jgi:FkbM family methyltransferase
LSSFPRRFGHQPPNPAHVSYSITNYQRGYSQESAYINVPTVALHDILEQRGIAYLELIKLDIEGAEIPVL